MEMHKLQPVGDRIVVRPDEPLKQTPGGILLPQTKEVSTRGVIVAVGPGQLQNGVRVPADVKVGDAIMYSKYGGTEIEIGDEKLVVLRESDILLVIPPELAKLKKSAAS